MNDQPLMGVGNRSGNFSEQLQLLNDRQLPFAAVIVQPHAVHILHDEVRQTLGRQCAAVELSDIWMNQPGQDPFFLLKMTYETRCA